MFMPKKLLYTLTILSLILTPLAARADGMVFIRPEPNIYLQETRQEAAIYFENELETLILSTTFRGNATDFGWVIPTPTIPEVEKASAEVFTKLQEITGVSYSRDIEMPMMLGSSSDKIQSVTVLETKKIDYYNIDILEATDAQALAKWLKENNYNFPEKEAYILNDYIQNNWYFVAVKIDTTAQGSERVNLDLEDGSATPLKIVFRTKNLVFPLKISSIKPEAVAQSTNEISFVDGTLGQAVHLPPNVTLSGEFQTVGPYNPLNNFTLSLAFKTDSPINDDYYRLINIEGTMSVNFSSFGFAVIIGGQEFSTESGPAVKAALNSEWNNLKITAQTGTAPYLYLNDVPFKLIDYRNPTQETLVSPTHSLCNRCHVIIGETETRINNVGIAFDEIKLWNYSSLQPPLLTIPFEGNLYMDINYQEANGHSRTLLSSNMPTPPPVTNYNQNQYVPIELYVIATHRMNLPGFSTPYAGWVRGKTIADLGRDLQGDPLIKPAGKKYFLTKLTNSMRQEDMTDDLFPRQADNDELVNGRDVPLVDTAGAVIWIVVLSVLLSIGLLSVLLWWNVKESKGALTPR